MGKRTKGKLTVNYRLTTGQKIYIQNAIALLLARNVSGKLTPHINIYLLTNAIRLFILELVSLIRGV
jgi:hypothetical protein